MSTVTATRCPPWCELEHQGGEDFHQAMASIPYAAARLNAPGQPAGDGNPYSVDLCQDGDGTPRLCLTAPNHDDGTGTTALTLGEAEQVARAIMRLTAAARKDGAQ